MKSGKTSSEMTMHKKFRSLRKIERLVEMKCTCFVERWNGICNALIIDHEANRRCVLKSTVPKCIQTKQTTHSTSFRHVLLRVFARGIDRR
jgi:hypothetical protein